jgi:predicted ribosome quality control (RQC) complex YloA/Tae2 family protein
VGHNIKTANRTAAINRNAARTQTLAEKLEEMGKLVGKIREELVEQVDLIIEHVDELETGFAVQIREINDRLDLLEVPIWRKIMDKVKEMIERGDPAKPANRAVQLDIHSTRHEAHSRIKKTNQKGEEVKDDGTKVEPSDS